MKWQFVNLSKMKLKKLVIDLNMWDESPWTFCKTAAESPRQTEICEKHHAAVNSFLPQILQDRH